IASCTSNVNNVTLQQAYNASTGGSTPEIVLDTTRGAVTIADNATPLGADLLDVQDNGGTTNYFAVSATGISTSGNLSVTGTSTLSGNVTVNNNSNFSQ